MFQCTYLYYMYNTYFPWVLVECKPIFSVCFRPFIHLIIISSFVLEISKYIDSQGHFILRCLKWEKKNEIIYIHKNAICYGAFLFPNKNSLYWERKKMYCYLHTHKKRSISHFSCKKHRFFQNIKTYIWNLPLYTCCYGDSTRNRVQYIQIAWAMIWISKNIVSLLPFELDCTCAFRLLARIFIFIDLIENNMKINSMVKWAFLCVSRCCPQ